MNKILVVDANPPWVRSLFSAMRNVAEIRSLRTRSGFGINLLQPWTPAPDGIIDRVINVPGWTKFPGLSTGIVARAVAGAIRKFDVNILVYTFPFYAGVAQRFAGKLPQVYYAHDPFQFYEWNVATTLALQQKIMQACDLTLAISQAMVEDLQKTSDRPVVYSPNAVSSSFLEKLSSSGKTADELQSLPRPIIGCVGQINSSYDWPLIGSLADAIPEATFVFVGNIFEEPAQRQQSMKAAMARPNVKWLGAKPHVQLPDFLRGFDVCFNPLAITDHSNRRSPLRLYDYLATDRPIVSTAIREAMVHEGLINTFKTLDEGVALLRQSMTGQTPVDMPARSGYIRRNTWEVRAMEVARHFDSLRKNRSAQ